MNLQRNIATLLKDYSIFQLQLTNGVTQEVRSSTDVMPHEDHLELTHAGKGKTIVPYSVISFINWAPKGQEPKGWNRDDD